MWMYMPLMIVLLLLLQLLFSQIKPPPTSTSFPTQPTTITTTTTTTTYCSSFNILGLLLGSITTAMGNSSCIAIRQTLSYVQQWEGKDPKGEEGCFQAEAGNERPC
jgi:hypothetical protein